MRPVSSLCGVVTALLHVLAGCAHGQRQELGMSFTRHPQPLEAPVGDDVNFECNLNLGADRFSWRHRPLGSDKWLPVVHTPSNSGKTSRHVVNFDNESKSGDYRCIAYYGSSGLASNPARLTLATLHKFSDKSDVVINVAAGNTVPITCPVPYSAPDAIVQFYKDNTIINNVMQRDDVIGSKTMVIENAKVSDSGLYHCAATNYISSQTYTSNHKTILNVHSNTSFQAPYFIKQPQTEYKVLKGKNVTLECFGAGYPVPHVTWSRLGSPLPPNSTKTSMGLTIVKVQPTDRGEYDCIWSINGAHIKSVIILKVMEAPEVIRPPKASTFSEGGELELSCMVTGEPQPKVEWLINGESLTPSDNVEIKGSTLLISEVQKKHAGIVQCVASNEYGSHSGCNLLWVNPKQHIGMSESRPNYEISNSRHKHTKGGGRRRNKEGKRKGTAVLVPPNQPNVTRLSDVSVMVRWSVPDNTGLPIQFFKVQYRELGQKMNGKQAKWMTANSEISKHVRSFEVTDLQPNHTYRFRIAAVYSNNDNKLSPNSARFHLNKNGEFESNKMPIPLLTNTEALGAQEVLLIWQNPDKSADIDGFYVYHRASSSAGDYVKTTVEGKDSYNITISHLQPDTTYEFKVQSFSVDAASEFSQILRQKTKKAVNENNDRSEDNRGSNHGSNLTLDSRVRPAEDKNVNMYAIIGGVLGGSTLLGGLTAIAVVYKRTKHKQSRESSQSEGKPITNGRVMNGGVTDSKINITSNPLAGLDASEDIIQPKVGIYYSILRRLVFPSFSIGRVLLFNSTRSLHSLWSRFSLVLFSEHTRTLLTRCLRSERSETNTHVSKQSGQQQSPMEMASFLNGQNNNSNNHNNSDTAGTTDVNASYTEPPLLQGSLPIEQPL
ncbi:interference hedgehog-like isoform X4 [Osmia bicornis bicornis]|nr:interference hedgehog-like isoform X4 [Osmia bicornis bicornis]XP_046143771.1 interference hedgehog-like isoform X4 [Osmia bicornis bicornis]